MDLQTKLDNLPTNPGVYLMKNDQGQVIYVGKAINLRNRVRSYFRSQPRDAFKTKALVRHIADLEYIITDSEIEALVLELNLIKKYRPKYNISLKDDKTYPYLKITKEDYPRVMVTRQVKKDGSKYYGPYPSVTVLRETLELLQRIFPYRSCQQRTFTNSRPCLNYHIKRCYAPCAGLISKEDYNQLIGQIADFFDGKQEQLISRLTEEMYQASEAMNFEQAARLRDQIEAINRAITDQKAVLARDDDQDVIAMARSQVEASVQIFFVRGGKVIGRENFFLDNTEDSERGEILASFIKQFYWNSQFIPPAIAVETELPEQDVLEQWLGQERGGRVHIRVPKRGQQKELVELVGRNALEALTKRELEMSHHKGRTDGAVLQLQAALGLAAPPKRIECYDISNTQGTESVGSMVVFVDGKPSKDQYRRFKIKTVEGPNDFQSMYEVLTRRFARASQEADQPEGKFSAIPDLVIIDGGQGQLGYARRAMREQGFEGVATFGLAKKEELLIRENDPEPVVLPRDSEALYLVQRIRDEAHRFAITYHRSLRGKRNLASVLDDIPGVGPKRKKNLLTHFGSFSKITAASVAELAQVEGISTAIAQEIYDYLRTHQDLQARLKNKG